MSESKARYKTGNQNAAGGDPTSPPPQGDGVIVFDATVYKVQTLVDMGLRITLDLPESAVTQAAQMMEIRRLGIPLRVDVHPVKQMESEHGKIRERSVGKSKRTPAQE